MNFANLDKMENPITKWENQLLNDILYLYIGSPILKYPFTSYQERQNPVIFHFSGSPYISPFIFHFHFSGDHQHPKATLARGAAPASPWGPGHREGSADEGASAKGGAGGVLADVLAALAWAAMRHATSTTMVAAAATRDRINGSANCCA